MSHRHTSHHRRDHASPVFPPSGVLGYAHRILEWLRTIDDIYVYVIISMSVALVYVRTVFFDFTYFDDHVLVLDNLRFLQDPGNLARTFTQEVFHILHASAAYYRPLLTISFMGDAILSGRMPGMYHLTNILIHVAASCALYLLLRTLNYRKDLSLSATLLVAVHPVLTQAVAWIPGRNDSLMAVFTYLTIACAYHFAVTRSWRAYGLSVFLFACALFTKETALVIPVVLSAILIIRDLRRRVIFISLGIGYVLVCLVWAVLRHHALQNPIPMTTLGMIQSIIANSPAAIQLLGKVVFPVNLTVLPIIQDTSFVWGTLSAILVIGMLIWAYLTYGRGERQKLLMMGVGLLWFTAFLLPSFIRPNPQIVADFIEHRLYVPLAGLVIFALESPIGHLWSHVQRIAVKGAVLATVMVTIALFGVVTVWHSGAFADRLTFWQVATRGSPHSPLAQRNLGAMYFLEGNFDRAETYFERSLELNPNEQMAHNNLGLIYMSRGQYDRAHEMFTRELKVNPEYDNTHYGLGLLYYKLGRTDEALKYWRKTLSINPDYADATRAIETVQSVTRPR